MEFDLQNIHREIEKTYEEVIRTTQELLNLLAVCLEPEEYDYVKQQTIVRLQVTRDAI